MGYENPLMTLGVPKRVLVREHALGTPEEILKFAESSYRALSKHYHPDLPGGDADLMAELGDAISELRDLDALKFYVDELVGEDDVQSLYREQQMKGLVTRDSQALTRLAESITHFDQYHALGVSKPTSFLTELEVAGPKVVVEVVSPHDAVARVTNLWRDDVNELKTTKHSGNPEDKFRYYRGSWRSQTYEGESLVWQVHTHFLGGERVKLVGFVDDVSRSTTEGGVSVDAQASIEAPRGQPRLNWELPGDCWFLSKMQYLSDSAEWRGSLVLYQNGRFALAGPLLAHASM